MNFVTVRVRVRVSVRVGVGVGAIPSTDLDGATALPYLKTPSVPHNLNRLDWCCWPGTGYTREHMHSSLAQLYPYRDLQRLQSLLKREGVNLLYMYRQGDTTHRTRRPGVYLSGSLAYLSN